MYEEEKNLPLIIEFRRDDGRPFPLANASITLEVGSLTLNGEIVSSTQGKVKFIIPSLSKGRYNTKITLKVGSQTFIYDKLVIEVL